MLLSSNKVYVGQSINLKKRIKQHLLTKDWWEKVILLTSENDSLNSSYITYLEHALIDKANQCGSLDCDNKTNVNTVKLDKFDITLLEQYLDEALFILKLIGVDVFTKTRSKPIIKSIPTPTSEQIELRAKSEVIKYIEQEQKFVLGKNKVYAKLQEKKNTFWINPRVDLLNTGFDLILNNQLESKIYILRIPANTFKASKIKDGNLIIRKDRPIYIDLNIDADTFVDVRSRQSFKSSIIKEIDYAI